MNIVNIIGDIAIMLSAHIKVHRPRLIDKEKLVSVIYLSLFSLFVSVSLSFTDSFLSLYLSPITYISNL